jgi:hypothetical protein
MTMTDLNGTGKDNALDQLIDDVVARRAAGTSRAEPDLAPVFGDAELLAALAQLSPVEWPADETGDKVAAGLATRRLPARSHRRPVAVGAAVIGTVAAAALLIAGAAQLTAGHGKSRPPAAGHTTAVARSTSPAPAHSGGSPDAVTAMSIVSNPGALRAVGVLGSNNDFLFCPTRRICYIQGYRNPKHAEIARTLDGGATWEKGAALPSFPVSDPWDAQMSCPTPTTCYSGYPTGLLVTNDGFAHFRVLPVPGPDSEIYQITCPTTLDCVAVVWHRHGPNTFIDTTDGWSTWATASAPSLPAADSVGELRCGRNGACVALLLAGTEQDALVSALSSTDGGRSWSQPAPLASIGDQEEWRFDCGDGRHCVVTGNDGTDIAWISVSPAGLIAIRVQPWPKSFPPNGDDVSCPTARACFIEVTRVVGGQDFTDNLIEVTHDAGRIWLAPVRTPIASTFLSCPVRAGCIAVAPKNSDNLVVLSNLRHAGQ